MPARPERCEGESISRSHSAERGEIFLFEGHLDQRIAGVGVKPGGYENYIGFKRDKFV